LHLNLDDAWSDLPGDLPVLDAREWGPGLRFSAPTRLIEEFYREFKTQLAPFLVYGSGDFHHLSALWLRRLREPFILISFDNHPDWDVRPPRWACGGWINRALEMPELEKVSVWGCGSFECWWPRQLFGNRRAEREGRLEVHPWADGRPAAQQNRRGAIVALNWRAKFTQFAHALAGANAYVTIDLDCLRVEEAITNWENGRFAAEDVVWALGQLRAAKVRIVAGDVCGAFSPPKYARAKQRFAAGFDHPKLQPVDLDAAQQTNLRAFNVLWPALTSER
jgi:arginase family enzyme